jgi:sulfur relay (sulfurtransferase) complex TusBCD TusD component (DsrE family)
MPDKKTLTFALMDPPFESARTTTALRLIDIAVRRGYAVNVFAYEGAVLLYPSPASSRMPTPSMAAASRRRTIS